MSVHALTIDHHHDPTTSTGIPNKKLLMWAFLASDCMFFGTLISTHLIYRLHPPSGGLDPKVVFSPELTSFSTFILLMSSLMMALAVTAGDRYGSGESPLLVTRPLLARPALPRFLRLGDEFTAGVVVNQRSGGTPNVTVRARATGVVQSGPATRSVTLAPGHGSEVRFAFRDTTADSSAFRFDVASQTDSDSVLVRLPGRPVFTPRAYTVSGSVTDTATAIVSLPGPIDPERSRIVFGIGTTPLAVLAGSYRWLSVYPFECSEQITDELLPLIALYRAGPALKLPDLTPERARAEILKGVAVLSARQRADGGIGLWSADGWTTPWLSAYAGEALLAARDAVNGVLAQTSARGQTTERPRVVLTLPPIGGERPDGAKNLYFLVADKIRVVLCRGLHCRDHHQLQEVVLEHVPQHAGIVVVTSPAANDDFFRSGDLDVVDVVPVPEWL